MANISAFTDIPSCKATTRPTLLDYTVNGRPLQRDGMPDSNHSQHPLMAPHYINPADSDDTWVAISCRDDEDWLKVAGVVGEDWAKAERFRTLKGRLESQTELGDLIAAWTRKRDKFSTADMLRQAGVPATPVKMPEERIDLDPLTQSWGLWPKPHHTEVGRVGVEGIPMHMSETDWEICHGGPILGEHNTYVYGTLLGLSSSEIADLKVEGTI